MREGRNIFNNYAFSELYLKITGSSCAYPIYKHYISKMDIYNPVMRIR